QDEQRSAAIGTISGFMIRQKNKQNKNEKGTLEFSLGNLFKCVCCVHSGISYEEKRLNEINESIQQINKHLNLLDRLHAVNIETDDVTQSSNTNVFPRLYFTMEETRKEEIHEGIELQHITDKSDQGNVLYKDVDDNESDILTHESATSSQDRSSFLISPYWLQDERLRRGVVDFLSNDEEEFWKDLIGKYLQPIESDEESQRPMKSLHMPQEAWTEIKSIVQTLTPCRVATKNLQREQLTFGDLYKEWTCCILRTQKFGTTLSEALVRAMKAREKQLFQSEPFLAGMFMDTRFSVLLSAQETTRATIYIRKIWLHIQRVRKNTSADTTSDTAVSGNEESDADEMEILLRNAEKKKRRRRNKCTTVIENIINALETHAKHPRLKTKESILEFWENK
ncbi:hypothetical protein ALC57_14659, partial [Trachymyrmex cornetzi]